MSRNILELDAGPEISESDSATTHTRTGEHDSSASSTPASSTAESPLADHFPLVVAAPLPPVNRPFDPDTDFLFVEAGRGGTLAFADKETAGRADIHFLRGGRVGTLWVYTCVAVSWTLDEHRSFFARMNAWSNAKMPQPRNYVDEKGGKEIQDAVLRQIQAEADGMSWQPEHDYFGLDITVCCRFPEFVVNGRKVLVAGCYVLRGIRDYFRYVVKLLQEKAESREEGARRISGIQESDPTILHDKIDEAQREATEEHVRAMMEAASCEMNQATSMRRKALALEQRADFDVETDPHGFVLRSRNGRNEINYVVSRWSSMTYEGIDNSDDLLGFFPRSGKTIGFQVSLPQRWSFCPTAESEHFEYLNKTHGIDEEEFERIASRSSGSATPVARSESIFEDEKDTSSRSKPHSALMK